MKKFFMLSLIAAFVTTINVSAQNNSYNMVIKMANGTTITIGPNEIDNIVFNDGAVTITGTKLSDYLEKIEAIEKDIAALKDQIQNVGSGQNISIVNGFWYIGGVNSGVRAVGYDGKDGRDGSIVTIGNNSNWFIDGKDTGIPTQVKGDIGVAGKDGHTPEIIIGDNGNWFIDGKDTGKQAVGKNGKDGIDGKDGKSGSTVTIGSNGHWFIDGVDTGRPSAIKGDVGAAGADGHTPEITIGDNGNWFIDGKDTGKQAVGRNGKDGKDGSVVTIGSNGNWFIDGVDTGIPCQVKK